MISCESSSGPSTSPSAPVGTPSTGGVTASQAKTKAKECKPVLKQMAVLEFAFFQERDKVTDRPLDLGFLPPESGAYAYSIEVTGPTTFRARAVLTQSFGTAAVGDMVYLDEDAAPGPSIDTTFHATGGLAPYYAR